MGKYPVVTRIWLQALSYEMTHFKFSRNFEILLFNSSCVSFICHPNWLVILQHLHREDIRRICDIIGQLC